MKISSVKNGATKLATWLLRRPAPTTFPEVSPEQRDSITSQLKTGDLLMSASMAATNLGHFAYWTVGANYSHSAIYDGKGQVVETRAEGVQINPVDEFFEGPIKVSVVRPNYESEQQARQIVAEAAKLKGVPYDFQFDSLDHSKLACAELIEVAMKKVDPNMEVPDVNLFGRTATVPDGFLEMPQAELLVDGDSNYWKNQMHSWPLYLTSAVAMGIGGMVGGPVGAGLGGFLAYEGAMAVGRLIKS